MDLAAEFLVFLIFMTPMVGRSKYVKCRNCGNVQKSKL